MLLCLFWFVVAVELVAGRRMELVFESDGPVVRDRVTEGEYQGCELRDPGFPFRFTLEAARVGLAGVCGTRCFDLVPCEVGMVCDGMIGPSVWNFFCTPLPDRPVCACAGGSLCELRGCVCSLDCGPRPGPCLMTRLIRRAFEFSTSGRFEYRIL
jgi:hypothetical protein